MAGIGLESFIDETIRLSRENGYHPTAFLTMRQRLGTVKAISKLVESGDIQASGKWRYPKRIQASQFARLDRLDY